MSPSVRLCLALSLVMGNFTSPLRAQEPAKTEKPTEYAPLRQWTRQELDRREAVKLFALGVMHEHANRLLEATSTFEKALRLDPESTAVRKALIPLYLALERTADALQTCRHVLDLDPGDYETWYLYAHQLRVQERSKEAIAALTRAAACAGLEEIPDLRLQIYFDLGVLYENEKDYDKAESAFAEMTRLLDKPEALIEQGPFNREEINRQAGEINERLGRVCIQAGHYEKAVAAFRKAQEKDPARKQRLNYNLAEVYVAQKKLEEALTCLDQYLWTQPGGAEPYELKINLLRRLGREREIVSMLVQYRKRDPHNASLKLLLARNYARAGDAEAAEVLFQEMAAEAPNPDVYRGLFALYKGQGRAGVLKVLTQFDKALAAATPDDDAKRGSDKDAAKARAMLAVLRDDADLVKALLPEIPSRLRGAEGLKHPTRFFLAVLAAKTRQLDFAEELYRSCLADFSEQPRRNNEPDVYGGLLKVLWQAHKYEAIDEICQHGLKYAERTKLVMFQAERARALVLLGKADKAVEEADAAVARAAAEDELYCRRNRAHVLSEAGRHAQAVAECQALLEKYTKSSEVHEIRYLLSAIYSQAKNHAKSEEQLQLILKEHKDDATAHNDLGYIWADQNKNLEEAEKLIRRAIELDRKQKSEGTHVSAESDQDNAAYIDSLGWVLFRRGQFQAARQELEKAAALPGGGEDPVVWDHLGDVYFRLEEPAKARTAWKKAVEMYDAGRRRQTDDRYKEIKQKLKLLEP